MQILAIHHIPGSFSDKWVEYCDKFDIDYKIVDCYRSDIVEYLKDSWGLMWHWPHSDPASAIFARQLIASLEAKGMDVFPNSKTSWHYDDKLGQKYLLEAIGAPLAKSYVFYSESEALSWSATAIYPKVFKLRGGAGSENVWLANDVESAAKFIKRSFGPGWRRKTNAFAVREALWRYSKQRSVSSAINASKAMLKYALRVENVRDKRVERDYAYFQDYINNDGFDVRVIVIGSRAFAIRRFVRKGDFRASGSGLLDYNPSMIPHDCLSIAFQAASALNAQCVAFDFVVSGETPFIVEIGYAFSADAYRKCPGYWDDRLGWHQAAVTPEWYMIRDFLASRQDVRG